MKENVLFVGLDIGSTTIKIVVMDNNRNRTDSETKVVNTNKVNKKAASSKPKVSSKKTKKNKNSKKGKIIKRLIILFLLLMIIGAGIFAGVIFGLMGDKFAITKDEMIIKYS